MTLNDLSTSVIKIDVESLKPVDVDERVTLVGATGWFRLSFRV